MASTLKNRETDALASAYDLIAELFVYPEEVDSEEVVRDALHETLPVIDSHVDGEAAELLADFLDDYREIEAEEYVETLELSPSCPLYIGDYVFEEPQTCRDIGSADRNQYMVELNAIYEHFGFEIQDELPDYLPAMIEFLGLTLPERDDGLRDEFMTKVLALLPAMIEDFESDGTPYVRLLKAFERVLRRDVELNTDLDPDGDIEYVEGGDS